MKLKLLVLALFVAPLALAQVPRPITLEHATERVDGSPLAMDEIDRAEVRCFVAGTETEVTALAIVPPSTSGQTAEVFTEGDYYCQAWTVDTLGQRSPEPTTSAVFTVAHPCKEAPSVENCAAPMGPRSIIIALEQ